ncbi:hypothetical protein CTI12_AA310250 [Artemisia annua]|uniref:Uncharacterized protein n=1 Tax=Artemisia annua TaxID=35608 RepID=A0A2U1N465_ARTAN|nr:hypothetical protein CTI12_AA310250 [Artemisia annua]
MAQMSEEAQAKLKDRIDDESEGMIVLKGILKRKGLPLTTTYEEYKKLDMKTRTSFDRTYEESYCDRLFANIKPTSSFVAVEEKNKWAPPVVPPLRPTYVITYRDRFDERNKEFKTKVNINRISYQDDESKNRRAILVKQVTKKRLEEYEEHLAKHGCPQAGMFTFHPSYYYYRNNN